MSFSKDEENIGCENIGSGDSNSEKLLKAENDNKEESLRETIKEMMALMRDWAFLMFAISNFLTSLGYPIPYSFATVSPAMPIVKPCPQTLSPKTP